MDQHFASDNNAGMCPEAIEALIAANTGHAAAYGDDPWTGRAIAAIRSLLEAPDAAVHFVLSGTAANAIALAHVGKPYGAIIAHASSHISTDEAGAPGFFSGGSWLKTADGPLAKLTPDDIARLGVPTRGIHSIKPGAVSITQSTEAGTVYSLAETRAVCDAARQLGLATHMDGARLANALVTLAASAADATWRAGVQLLSLGGVKNGLGAGEAIVVFDPAIADEIGWRIKQAGQLTSKMRFLTAPWVGLLESGTFLSNARHANQMALRLASAIGQLPQVEVRGPVEANAVFADVAPAVQAAVRAKGWRFYTFSGATLCRLMCAWDTRAETVDRFAADIASAARA